MYLDSIHLTNFRTFVDEEVDLVHPEKDFKQKDKNGVPILPRPKLPNVNLLLGDNGSGKTALLKAISLAGFGPAVSDVKIQSNYLVRNPPNATARTEGQLREALVSAQFLLHEQDGDSGQVNSEVKISRRGELEGFTYTGQSLSSWNRVYESTNDAFFMVGYGATRRVERSSGPNGQTPKSSFLRAQRVQGLFEDSFALIPLGNWLPRLKTENRGRYTQVVHLIERLLGRKHYRFTGETKAEEYLFEQGGIRVPFQAMSDGYRAFLGWVGDLLYHVCYGCPPGKKLVDNTGIVMVDEIDLHLHPKWQMEVIRIIAKALPRMQFIFTSHSPLVAGSLEWMNIIFLKSNSKLVTKAQRRRESIHGLDADQVLLTGYFEMNSTRAGTKEDRLHSLTLKARHGDEEAAKQLVLEMSQGTEASR
jgi:ABC-type cobalamin/Fe3+-siderophores transport system ATPase subunit